ncbi:hypothetical protein [Yersinia enterocolitica]|uniref:hypothetical protein n=1 Tax=Yersinia enterocolitica TaxID=630 RepID=UPI003CFE70E1
MKIDISIITSTAGFVKPAPKKQQRVNRPAIAINDITETCKARGRHIAKCQHKKQSVRIPAMHVSELGQVLRTLELKRAYA